MTSSKRKRGVQTIPGGMAAYRIALAHSLASRKPLSGSRTLPQDPFAGDARRGSKR